MKSLLQTIIEDAGYNCRSYSGRSMYGRECLGAECTSLPNFLSDVMATAIQYQRDNPEKELDSVTDAFRSMRTDNMGYDVIVYFTDTDFSEEEPEGDFPTAGHRCHPECGCDFSGGEVP